MARKIWVSTTAFQLRGGPTIEANTEKASRLIDQAAVDKPDIICLPETFPSHGLSNDLRLTFPQPVPGPVTDMASAKEKQYNTHIICPLLEKRNDRIYNTAVVIDRNGHIVGTYDKLHPVTTSANFTEFENGVTPGCEPKVFDLDFGRIGILICFDILWPAEFAALKTLGAEIVFWPSAYDGGFPLQALAWNHKYYVVSSVLTSQSRIIDITGEILGKTGQRSAVIGLELNLDKRYFHTDFNASQMPALKAKYGRDITVRVYHEEAGLVIESNRSDLCIEDIMKEFDLELGPDYIARHNLAEKTTRHHQIPEPQKPRQTKSQWA